MPIENIDAFVEALVKRDSGRLPYLDNPLFTESKDGLPGFKEIREESCWHYEGTFPQRLMKEKRPNEDELWREFKRANYEPITVSDYNKAVDKVSVTVTQTNWQIDWPSNSPDQEVFEDSSYFDGKDFIGWLNENVCSSTMPKDSNSVFVALPMLDKSGQVLTKYKCIDSTQLLIWEPDLIAWKEYLPELYQDDEGQIKEGKVYYIIDDTNAFRVIQKSESEYLLETVLDKNGNPLQHDGPIWQVVGGREEWRKGRLIYRNFYNGYYPPANNWIKSEFDRMVVRHQMAHPIPIIKPQPCNNCVNGQTDEGICGTCRGTGEIIDFSYPGQGIKRGLDGFGQDKELLAQIPPLEYVRPPVESLEEMRKECQQWKDSAREALNRLFIQDVQSGVAKEQDREDERNFVKMVSDYVWCTLVPGLIRIYMKVEHGANWEQYMPNVIPPTQFKLESPSDLLNEIESAADMPEFIRAELVDQYINKRWPNDRKRRRRMQIAMLLDPLARFSIDGKNLMVNSGQATQDELFISSHIYPIIQEIEEEQGEEFRAANMGLDILFRGLAWWRNEVITRIEAIKPDPMQLPDLSQFE